MRAAVLAACLAGIPPAEQRPGIRLLQWNVSDSAWVKRADLSRAVLRHADPDIVVLVQVAPAIDAGTIRSMLTGLRGPADTTWFISAPEAGRRNERTVIASRDSLRELPELARLEYPGTGALAMRAAAPDSAPREPRAVRANGALIKVDGRWILVAGVHLTCCGTAGSWREDRRLAGAVTVRDAIRPLLAQHRPAAVVIAGDLNLVAGQAPMDSLLATTRDMRRAEAVRENDTTSWTWDGSGTPFPNGRLDHVLYSSGTIGVVRATVLDGDTSRAINRHRPLLVELRAASH